MWSQVMRVVEEKQRFILTTHSNPDLDALGSELALDEFLRSLGKDVAILNSDAVPRLFRFVDPRARLRTFSPGRDRQKIARAEAIFVLDASGNWERMGRVGAELRARVDQPDRPLVVCIDHHAERADFADLAVIDPGAAATGELVFDLIRAAGGALTPSIAEQLYLAILTDTGSFRYPKTSLRTHRIAAELIAAGASPVHLYKQVYEQSPLELVRLKGFVLNSLQLSVGGQLAWCALDQATLKAYGVSPADLDGFPGLAMQVGGVRVSLLCVEKPKGRVKVSLRSDGSLAIHELAGQLGGGGHPSAAGATVGGNLAEVTERVIASLETMLRKDDR